MPPWRRPLRPPLRTARHLPPGRRFIAAHELIEASRRHDVGRRDACGTRDLLRMSDHQSGHLLERLRPRAIGAPTPAPTTLPGLRRRLRRGSPTSPWSAQSRHSGSRPPAALRRGSFSRSSPSSDSDFLPHSLVQPLCSPPVSCPWLLPPVPALNAANRPLLSLLARSSRRGCSRRGKRRDRRLELCSEPARHLQARLLAFDGERLPDHYAQLGNRAAAAGC